MIIYFLLAGIECGLPTYNQVIKSVIAWLLSTLCVHSHVATDCWKIKKCEISLAIASYAAEFVRSYEKLHRACRAISFVFAVIVFVFAVSVFTPEYLRLSKAPFTRPNFPS